MYILASHLKNLPILSLRNGYPVAHVTEPVIDRDKLSIVAVYCRESRWKQTQTVIMVRDIREIAREGLVIDSLEDIEEVDEIVRLKSIINQKFKLVGVNVVTEAGDSLGKVEDFTVNVKNFDIQKLYVKQSVLKNLLLNNLVIDRVQIIEITDKQITVRDAKIPKAGLAPAAIPES
jgi:uncharacterized protein YrrD